MEANSSRMDGKSCVITGATSGIGLVAAREIARLGARLVIVGRNQTKCAAAVREIGATSGNQNVEALVADFSRQDDIRRLAQQIRKRHSRLDVLINNAGGIRGKRELTPDRIEMTFAVNHLAPFLLTNLLLDLIKASDPARIINVSSAAHSAVDMDFDNLMGERRFTPWRAYCMSKLENLLFTYELARRLSGTGVTVNALHPGWVKTGFGGDAGWRGVALQALAKIFAIRPEQGARTTIYLASSPEVEGVTGKYFVRQKETQSSAASQDVAAGKRLWEISAELTHLDSGK